MCKTRALMHGVVHLYGPGGFMWQPHGVLIDSDHDSDSEVDE